MRLIVASGALQGDVFEITKDDVTIGRGANNDIVISDPATSRTHCQIRREGNKYIIQDANSANGTYINDERIALPYVLRGGDQIRLGETTLRVEDADSTPVPGEDVVPAAAGTPAGGRGGLLAAIAALAVIVLLIAAALMNQRAPTQVAAGSTSTRAATTAPAATTLAPAVTSTSAPAATATSVLATTSPMVTAAPISTAAPGTLGSVATPTAVGTAPATLATFSTPVPGRNYPIPVPTLLIPVSGAKFTSSDPIQFSWSGSNLGSNEVFRVQVSTNNEFSKIACEIRTQDTTATIPGDAAVCTDLWQYGKQYFWRAQIVQRDALSPDSTGSTYTGPVSEFSWAP